MKRGFILLLLATAAGCSRHASDTGSGFLRIELNVSNSVEILTSKSSDPSTFTLDISQGGEIVRTLSPVGNAIAPIELAPGNYTVSAYSEPFTAPAFDKPVYGGSADTAVPAEGEAAVSVACTQTNAGVAIAYTKLFESNHPVHSAVVRQVAGALSYTGSDAGRTGYFLPGEATVTITAGDVDYEYELSLKPRTNYNIVVDDTPQPASGKLSVSITVSTAVAQENIGIVFPSGRIGYSEAFGETAVGQNTLLPDFDGWSDAQAAYDGAGASVSSQSPSDGYADASQGNNLLFASGGSSFTVTGLNTSMAGSKMTLSFGACNTTRNYSMAELTVGVSSDGTNFVPLAQPENAHSPNRKWEKIVIGEGIPRTKSLSIRFDCQAANYRIDDIRLETTR